MIASPAALVTKRPAELHSDVTIVEAMERARAYAEADADGISCPV
jgi:hypothetical protein